MLTGLYRATPTNWLLLQASRSGSYLCNIFKVSTSINPSTQLSCTYITIYTRNMSNLTTYRSDLTALLHPKTCHFTNCSRFSATFVSHSQYARHGFIGLHYMQIRFSHYSLLGTCWKQSTVVPFCSLSYRFVRYALSQVNLPHFP